MYQMTSLLKARTMISSIFPKKRKVKLKMKWTWKNNLIQQKSLAALVEVKCKTKLKKEFSGEEV
jgi:Ser-tRNA(Ala) deacylase AlaX